ncbi:hypothetical protein SKAU_G00291690 [Synaphobranchus kaupii]|uniref:Uncharacterized protein n=1 Tax=Synaphobranchus kaupii TaxID=118154 RepID=A0A9Q1ETW1_SYNKA|nr:hypothetical protein SKAU_G00291690 [Synaphobranchus kaupii]
MMSRADGEVRNHPPTSESPRHSHAKPCHPSVLPMADAWHLLAQDIVHGKTRPRGAAATIKHPLTLTQSNEGLEEDNAIATVTAHRSAKLTPGRA